MDLLSERLDALAHRAHWVAEGDEFWLALFGALADVRAASLAETPEGLNTRDAILDVGALAAWRLSDGDFAEASGIVDAGAELAAARELPGTRPPYGIQFVCAVSDPIGFEHRLPAYERDVAMALREVVIAALVWARTMRLDAAPGRSRQAPGRAARVSRGESLVAELVDEISRAITAPPSAGVARLLRYAGVRALEFAHLLSGRATRRDGQLLGTPTEEMARRPRSELLSDALVRVGDLAHATGHFARGSAHCRGTSVTALALDAADQVAALCEAAARTVERSP